MTKSEVETIVECFKDVVWHKQSFYFNGEYLKDPRGNTTFYATGSIDDAISKLNKLLDALTKDEAEEALK